MLSDNRSFQAHRLPVACNPCQSPRIVAQRQCCCQGLPIWLFWILGARPIAGEIAWSIIVAIIVDSCDQGVCLNDFGSLVSTRLNIRIRRVQIGPFMISHLNACSKREPFQCAFYYFYSYLTEVMTIKTNILHVEKKCWWNEIHKLLICFVDNHRYVNQVNCQLNFYTDLKQWLCHSLKLVLENFSGKFYSCLCIILVKLTNKLHA